MYSNKIVNLFGFVIAFATTLPVLAWSVSLVSVFVA